MPHKKVLYVLHELNYTVHTNKQFIHCKWHEREVLSNPVITNSGPYLQYSIDLTNLNLTLSLDLKYKMLWPKWNFTLKSLDLRVLTEAIR